MIEEELEAKKRLIEVKFMPKKRLFLKTFLKGSTTNQEIPKFAATNKEILKCAAQFVVAHFKNSPFSSFL